ncbi:MAG: hypothetical protein ACLSVX_09535 [Massilimicrobiota timonensis]
MWMLLGILTIVMTILNICAYQAGKNYQIFMAFALLLTSLTVCDQYQMIASWSKAGDWSAISDVAPSISIILWIFVIGSFIVNVIPMLLSDYHNK